MLRLNLLGHPFVTCNGMPVRNLTFKKSLALLAYLAVTQRAHSRRALAGLLWAETCETNARASLRKVIAELQHEFSSYLLVSREDVTFDWTSRYELDVSIFEQSINRVLGIPREGSTLEAAHTLEEAMRGYHGCFLEDFYVHHAPAFEEWVLGERERLQRLVLWTLHTLLVCYAENGEPLRAMETADQLLALEPAHEEAHRQKMRLLVDSGRRSAALRQYGICRQNLRSLGAEPSLETRQLYDRICHDLSSSPAATPGPQYQLAYPELPPATSPNGENNIVTDE